MEKKPTLKPLRLAACLLPIAATSLLSQQAAPATDGGQPKQVFGYRDFSQQAKWDAVFMAVPDARLAGEHLKILTAEPHWASSPEDYKTAQYVAEKFKEAGLGSIPGGGGEKERIADSNRGNST